MALVQRLRVFRSVNGIEEETMKPTVCILAAGESTRFVPFSDKNTFLLLGKPLLLWKLEQLVRLGIERCIIVCSKNNEETVRRVLVPQGLAVIYVCQEGEGQGNGVLAAKPHIGNDPMVIMNGSDWYDDASLKPFVSAGKKEILLGAVRMDSYFPGGYLIVDNELSVSGIVEKPGAGKEPSPWVRVVIDRIEHPENFFTYVEKTRTNPAAGYEQAITEAIADGITCGASTITGTWLPIKYPWHILAVAREVLSTISGQTIAADAQVKDGVILEGPVIIESGVRIFEGVKIVGPTYIGKNTIVGNNTMIRESILGENCVTGFASDITRSVIGNGCWFHTNYVGDSVLDDNVSMGSGAVCANLRLDDGIISTAVKGERISTSRNKLGSLIGKNVRIGVNVSIMPGVCIGSGSFVSSGLTITENIPAGSFVKFHAQPFDVAVNTCRVTKSREEFAKKL